MRLLRTAARLSAALTLTAVPIVAVAPAADAASYRYWAYYHWQGGEWAFAKTGPADFVPKDGAVEGWRFAVHGQPSRQPRAAGQFGEICAGTPAAGDQKRVAVVLDFGTPEDSPGGEPPAPRGECAVVAQDATGAQVLAAVTTVRSEDGLLCAIDRYPSEGCGDQVEGPAPEGREAPVELVLPAAATPPAPPSDEPTTEVSSEPSATADAEEEVAAASGSTDAADTADAGGLPLAALAGVGALAALGVAAALRFRRSR